MTKRKPGPVLIEIEDGPAPSPAEAPTVPEPELPAPSGTAMQGAVSIAARKPSRLLRWFWSLLMVIVGLAVSIAAYDFVTGLIERQPVLGYLALGFVTAFILVLLIIAFREWMAFVRLRRVDALHRAADAARAHDDLNEARDVVSPWP